MKYLYILAFFISSAIAQPAWYHTMKNTKQNTYIGYGSAFSEQEAKQNALVDISSQISTKINSKITRTKQNIAGNFQKDTTISSAQSTNTTLSDYKLLKMNFEKGKYFIAVEYENISSLQKFQNKLKARNIKVRLEKYFTNFDLVRKDKRWYIKYQDIMQVLDEKDISKFFVSIKNTNLSIKTNKKNDILYDGDEFYFKVKSSKKGYVSIATVYENGTVSVLMKNIPIEANIIENIPDKDFESIPEAGLLQKGIDTYDMYVMVYSSKKLLWDNFALADDELVSSERYKNFDELQEFLQNKKYTTLKVVTKAR